MKRLLHIIATPRGEESRTLKLSEVFLSLVTKKYKDCKIDELNVFEEPPAPLTIKAVHGKYILLGGGEITEGLRSAWRKVEVQIERFLAQDAYLITAPMWNFNIPYELKHYIDVIVQPKYLFRYTPQGVEGLVKNRKMVVISTRGGDYKSGSPFHSYDFQEPYLRALFGFCGIQDITFITAQPMDMGPEAAKEELEKAMSMVRTVAESF